MNAIDAMRMACWHCWLLAWTLTRMSLPMCVYLPRFVSVSLYSILSPNEMCIICNSVANACSLWTRFSSFACLPPIHFEIFRLSAFLFVRSFSPLINNEVLNCFTSIRFWWVFSLAIIAFGFCCYVQFSSSSSTTNLPGFYLENDTKEEIDYIYDIYERFNA